MQLFDSISVIARVKLTGELSRALSDLAALAPGPKTVLTRLRLSSRIREILLALGSKRSAPEAESDDPNSPNYRFRDTGYIADSRKERAAEMIRRARSSGQRLRATDVDWDAIESNPRAAKEIIVKSNLFGTVDWNELAAGGMTAAAGFLIDRIYAAIGTEPDLDTPQARRDYVVGLETLRTRLEAVKTVDEVLEVLSDIRDESRGTMLNPDEQAEWTRLNTEIGKLNQALMTLRRDNDVLYQALQAERTHVYKAEHEIGSRQRRGWSIPPSMTETLAAAKERSNAAEKKWVDALSENKPRIEQLRAEASEKYTRRQRIDDAARARNLAENALVRAWRSLGKRFAAVLGYRSTAYGNKGSSAFASHVTNALNGRIADWSWAEKAGTEVKRATKEGINFQLMVADTFDRKGGRPVDTVSTHAIKDAFGFRDVQSGNWVLSDPVSARFHVEQTAGAMNDLADVVGIDAAALGLGGRLGMAFGARGRGGKNAARAHYEPVQRVINLTKIGGGGCLAHEYFHAVDNMLGELQHGQAAGVESYFTRSPEVLKPGPVQDAAAALRKALLEGEHRAPETVDFKERDIQLAKRNIRDYAGNVANAIKVAGNATDAILAVDSFYSGRSRGGKNHKAWRRIAAAHYAEPGTLSVTVLTGPKCSSYALEASKLDDSEFGKYWSKDIELAARAFQGYTEDKLKALDRRNDYLSNDARNSVYPAGVNPFPEGEERDRINTAFDALFAAIRDEQIMEKAAANKPLLDSIFGTIATNHETVSALAA